MSCPASGQASARNASQSPRYEPTASSRTSEGDGRDARMMQVAQSIAQRSCDGDGVSLATLAAQVRLSPYYLQRSFKAALGLTPRQYAAACRLVRLKAELRSGRSVTDAVYAAGFGAPSRVYEGLAASLGMTPGQYRHGGLGLVIWYAALPSPLGRMLLAATDRGLCTLQFGASPGPLRARLRREFPRAELRAMPQPAGEPLSAWLRALEEFFRQEAAPPRIPIAARGTAFQFQVWRFLQTIPRGQTRSYGQVAAAIGRPRAARAVARACAENPVALLIPCHRVLRGDGAIGGYRWGVKIKEQLLAREASAAVGRPDGLAQTPPRSAAGGFASIGWRENTRG